MTGIAADRPTVKMFDKVLVANRGEIAIRGLRAAVESGSKTVAVYPYEDRNSPHRQKADEAYQIGAEGHPVRAYLTVAEIIRIALQAGADWWLNDKSAIRGTLRWIDIDSDVYLNGSKIGEVEIDPIAVQAA